MPIGTKIKGFARLAAASLMWIAVRPVTMALSVLSLITLSVGAIATVILSVVGALIDKITGFNTEYIFKVPTFFCLLPTMVLTGLAASINRVSSPIISNDLLVNSLLMSWASGAARYVSVFKGPLQAELVRIEADNPSWFRKGQVEMSTGEDFAAVQAATDAYNDTSLSEDNSALVHPIKSAPGVYVAKNKLVYFKDHENVRQNIEQFQKLYGRFKELMTLSNREMISVSGALKDCNMYLKEESIKNDHALHKTISDLKGNLEGLMESDLQHKEPRLRG